MGTDIHIYAEKFDGTCWKQLPIKVPDSRNYLAFAILADVRNGVGFAGCVTGKPVEPISQPRGLPSDTSIHDNDEDYDSPLYCWLGDHSYSWVLLSELRSIDLSKNVTEIGMISPEQAHKLDNEGELPTYWCGWTSNATAVRRSWQRHLRESTPLLVAILDVFKDETEPESIRFVFGFDS